MSDVREKLATGRVGVYARYSSDLQNENSIEDQDRRARQEILKNGGDPIKARLFLDKALSGSNMSRPGLEALMKAVERKEIDVIITEDVSRLSRDVGDAANIFKRLRFAGVPLISLSDGMDTTSKHAKLTFAIKSMFAEQYLDDLADKTLRGLEGRMLAGFATGQVPYGFRTVADTDAAGRIVHRIEIDENEAPIVRRIYDEYLAGGTLHGIARKLNLEWIPSPRAGSKHKRFGWGSSTIRAILYNDRYNGTWRFKEKQWVKVPGTNKRLPRMRPADEVITIERPELRIVDAAVFAKVRALLVKVHRRYTHHSEGNAAGTRKRCVYPLSGVLVCDACGFPLTIYGSKDFRYYRCSTNHTKGTCPNDFKTTEKKLRETTLGAIRDQLQNPAEVELVRRTIAERLRDSSKELDQELKDRRDRLKRTEERIKGLVQFIADGDRSDYVVATLRDLEAQAKTDRAAIDQLQREAQEPLRLPSLNELTEAVFRFDEFLNVDPNDARAALRRWLKDGEVRVARTPDGFEVSGEVAPLKLAEEAQIHRNPEGFQRSRDKFVAGALLAHLSIGYRGEIWRRLAR